MTWEPLEVVSRTVTGPDSFAPRLLIVELKLSAEAPDEWAAFFEKGAGVPFSASLHKAHVLGDTITVRTDDDELERAVGHAAEMVVNANDYYLTSVSPAKEEARQREEAQARAARERIDNAQARLNDLDP